MPRPVLPILLLITTALPASAQTAAPAPAAPPALPFEMPMADDPPPAGADNAPLSTPRPDAPAGDGSPLDELFGNLLRQAEPHLEGLARDMGGLFNEYAPAFDELTRLMDDISNYELPPQRLPNGDILIRRKSDAPPPPPLTELPNLMPRGGDQPAAPGPGGIIVTPGEQIEL